MLRLAKRLEAIWRRLGANDPDLAYLLGKPGKVAQIGPESGKIKENGVVRHDSPHGSYRYVMYVEGVAVAALQVMSRDGKAGLVANVFTHPSHRRQGYASALLREAKKDFKEISHQPREDRSESANLWLDSDPA